ncbi:MORN repeat-containing protein 4-like [Tubulanus polymorphus]|uniref:MORN repeat-containing protein 4-like n=1 Tax=Tubulanus polymorphus TaxID=672921 RepID=UPI003DA42174
MGLNGHYKYTDGSEYIGEWNEDGKRHGMGHMILPDGSKYHGSFDNGFCSGLGMILFADGSRYEGEFKDGKFHGYGIFTRCDGMRYEGQLNDGKINGLGLLTYPDGTHGLPRQEGLFEACYLKRREKCSPAVKLAQNAAEQARKQN